jgi:SAM-dependent methyltransferase
VPEPDEAVRRLVAASRDDPLGFFERLYVAAEAGEAVVPWDRGEPNRLLAEWVEGARPRGDGRRAVVVGAGLGADAELIASLGFATLAFDLSPTGVRTARARHPGSPVDYVVADLLDLPPEWAGRFDLVFEGLTVQSMPEELHARAIAGVRSLVAPGGTLLVIATAREEGAAADGPPWPLTRSEIDAFGLRPVGVELLGDEIKRWRAEFRG